MCLGDDPGLGALLGLLGDELVGVASYEVTRDGAAAEIALAVADEMHRLGVATLLLEHLVSLARAQGVKILRRRGAARQLPRTAGVRRCRAGRAAPVRRRRGGLAMPSRPTRPSARRTRTWTRWPAGTMHADVASLEPLLAPRSAAVVGSGRSASIGRTILLNIREAGFAGRVRGQPARRRHRGHPVRRVGRRLPEAPDLAVITVPAARVAGGGAGVWQARNQVPGGGHLRPDAAQESGLLEASPAGKHAPGRPELLRRRRTRIGLEATFAVHHPSPGKTGLVGSVRRRRRGAGRAVLPPGHRGLLVRLGRRQAGCFQYRHAAVVGGGRHHRAGRAVPGIVRKPAQVRQDRAPGAARGCPS